VFGFIDERPGRTLVSGTISKAQPSNTAAPTTTAAIAATCENRCVFA